MLAKQYSKKRLTLPIITITMFALGLFLGLSFFVFAQDSSDVIGVRVFANPDHLSPVKWYERNVPNPGAPILIEVDGYEAVKDGRTIYINGANTVVPGEAGCPGSATQDCIYTNIYVISYSEGASADTAQIFQQMLDNFELNINLANIQACGSDETTTTYYCTESHEPCANQAVCTASDPSETNLCQIIPCSTDIDCRYLDDNPLCGAKKDKLRRDTKRLSDVQELVERVDDYKSTTGELPRLQAGTYLEKHSFSAWPSWQATLGNELGVSLLLDPLNQFIGCRSPCCDEGSCLPGVACPEAETCWDPEGLLLGCPEDAYLYGYGYDDVSDTARLYYNVEYREAAWYTNPLSGVGVGDILTILSEQKCLGGSRHGLSCVGGCPGGECVDYCFGYQGAVTDDYDGDGYPDATDNCPRTWNDPQTDTDLDGVGDVCDPCPDSGDVDGDGFPDNDNDTDGYCEGASYHYPKVGGGDNCPFDYNPAQNPDACSLCIDLDNDTHCENGATPDNCPGVYNDPQTDTDSDGLGDACDICLFDKFNDSDDDGVCGLYDSDGDGISDSIDNCPVNYNPGQEDFDSDADLVNCNYNVDGDLHLINDSPPYCSGGAVALPTGDCPAGSSLCGGNACDEQYCGNGVIDPGEQCDGQGGDGSGSAAQYLCVNCQTAGGYCGDGDVQYGFEACDCGDPAEYNSGGVTGSNCADDTAPLDTYIQDPAGTEDDNQYLCLNNCQEWGGGWCGDAEIQDGLGAPPFDIEFEGCEGTDGGEGTSSIDEYGCSNCNKGGGYCGDGILQDWHGEGCDGAPAGAFKGISIEYQYSCTCLPPYTAATCPTKTCDHDDTITCASDADCGAGNRCATYDSMCQPTEGWCGDGKVQGAVTVTMCPAVPTLWRATTDPGLEDVPGDDPTTIAFDESLDDVPEALHGEECDINESFNDFIIRVQEYYPEPITMFDYQIYQSMCTPDCKLGCKTDFCDLGTGCYLDENGNGTKDAGECQKGKFLCDAEPLPGVKACIDVFTDPIYQDYVGEPRYDYCCVNPSYAQAYGIGLERLAPSGTFSCDEICADADKVCVGVGTYAGMTCQNVGCHASGGSCTGYCTAGDPDSGLCNYNSICQNWSSADKDCSSTLTISSTELCYDGGQHMSCGVLLGVGAAWCYCK